MVRYGDVVSAYNTLQQSFGLDGRTFSERVIIHWWGGASSVHHYETLLANKTQFVQIQYGSNDLFVVILGKFERSGSLVTSGIIKNTGAQIQRKVTFSGGYILHLKGDGLEKYHGNNRNPFVRNQIERELYYRRRSGTLTVIENTFYGTSATGQFEAIVDIPESPIRYHLSVRTTDMGETCLIKTTMNSDILSGYYQDYLQVLRPYVSIKADGVIIPGCWNSRIMCMSRPER